MTPPPPSGAVPERPPNYFSLDQQRVRLVADVVRQHSPLGQQDALDLAARVLHTVDHLPETLRHARPPTGTRA